MSLKVLSAAFFFSIAVYTALSSASACLTASQAVVFNCVWDWAMARAGTPRTAKTATNAKTICLRVGEQVMLVVAGGTARLDNRKSKDCFRGKPRMLGLDEVVEITGHPIGGVCPFGLRQPLPIYCDVSLRRFAEVLPAAGAVNAAVRIATERLAEITDATWVDICQ